MTRPRDHRDAAAELRRLADLIERDPPAKVDVSYRRRLPFEATGADVAGDDDGFEYAQIEVRW